MTTYTNPQANGLDPSSDARPRVLLLINKLGGGGAERDVAILCKHADPSRFAFEVWTLLSGHDLEPIVRQSGVKMHCLRRPWAYDPLFALRAAREIARADFDLIHVFLPAIAFYAALAKVIWHARAPLIYSELSARPRRGLKSAIRRWSLRHCDAFCANSASSRAYLQHTGIAADRVHLVPNGHDVARFRAMSVSRDTLRARLGVRPDQSLAVYVGRLIPSKRVGDLLDAVALLQQTHPHLQLALVGEGPERTRLQHHAASLKLQSRVRFLGRRLDIPDLLQCADLFVFPSETEGLSNAVIEAALAGLPIVACDIGGVREIVLDGRGAFLVPCRHPQALAVEIARVLDHPAEAARRAELSQRFAENEYAISRVTQRTYCIYEEVLHA